jgi:[ribosomal protein S5]-alanine N-acetyltransferase
MRTAFHIETARLILREFTRADAPYMLRQLNEPSFIENIADRGVRTLAQAERYLENGPLASYPLNGFGFWAVVEKSSNETIGMCGLVKRPNLDYADLGYAFLPEFTGQGYAFEAGQACLKAARDDFNLPRLLAIVNPGNMASRRLLEKLDFAFARMQTVHNDEPALCVYQRELLEPSAC